jgi:diguanylate cyclase (GGDEF)-like protein
MQTPFSHYAFFFAAAFFGALFLSLEYDLLRTWDTTPSDLKKLQVEEIFALGSILVIGLLVFSWQRMRDREQEASLRIAAEREAYASARSDTLTGLPNRKLFLERAGTALHQCWEHGTECVVLFIDLDGFKPVNDLHGHAVGDVVLMEAARRLGLCVPETGIVARFGGDEFVLLCEAADGLRAAQSLAQKIIREIERPVTVDGHEITIGATIGVAIGPGQGRRAEDLVQAADLAMYEGKRSGRGKVVHSGLRPVVGID